MTAADCRSADGCVSPAPQRQKRRGRPCALLLHRRACRPARHSSGASTTAQRRPALTAGSAQRLSASDGASSASIQSSPREKHELRAGGGARAQAGYGAGEQSRCTAHAVKRVEAHKAGRADRVACVVIRAAIRGWCIPCELVRAQGFADADGAKHLHRARCDSTRVTPLANDRTVSSTHDLPMLRESVGSRPARGVFSSSTASRQGASCAAAMCQQR